MSSFTKEELHKFSNELSWRCFGITRVPASVDGVPVSCELIDGKKLRVSFVDNTSEFVESSTIGEEVIPEPLTVRENGQSGKNVLADYMENYILSGNNNPGYRGDNWY